MLEMEREEESKRLKKQRITEEAEHKTLASEYTKRDEKLKEWKETERKFQKLTKTMDYLERDKREEEAPLIEAAHQIIFE